MVILDFFNQLIVCVQKFGQFARGILCSRDSSYSAQNVHNEVSVSLTFFSLWYVLYDLVFKLKHFMSKVSLCSIK